MEKSTRTFRRIAAHYLYTPRGFLRGGILSVDAEGRIAAVETSDRVDSLPGVEFYSGILIPGTVNAHCHLELSHLQGAVPAGCGLAAFARAVGMLRRSRTPQEREEAARYRIARMRAEGTVAVGDTCNGTGTFRIKRESPLYFHNFLELFGLRTTSAGPLEPLAETCRAYGLPFSVTPHSTYSLSRDVFSRTADDGRKDEADGTFVPHSSGDTRGKGAEMSGPLSIHFMESEEERALYRGEGALWEWYRECGLPADFTGEGSPAERILRLVPRDRNLLLVHGTFATEEEIATLQEHFGERLTWVLCPRSNAYVTGGYPPVELLRRHGARIALGTDSAASNGTLSMLGEMQTLKGIPLEELLGWATAGGARALGIDDRYGSLEAGKRPGVALLEGADLRNMRLTPASSLRRLV